MTLAMRSTISIKEVILGEEEIEGPLNKKKIICQVNPRVCVQHATHTAFRMSYVIILSWLPIALDLPSIPNVVRPEQN